MQYIIYLLLEIYTTTIHLLTNVGHADPHRGRQPSAELSKCSKWLQSWLEGCLVIGHVS